MPHRPRLYVEGVDDAHALRNLLWPHGWGEGQIGIRDKRKSLPEGDLVIDPTGGGGENAQGNDDGVLRALRVNVPVAQSALGVVLDADLDRTVAQRWDQIRGILAPLGMAPPTQAAPDGFVGLYVAGEIEIKVGVWLMPDNVREGGIETFLADLAGADDPVLRHARASTQDLIDAGHARFTNAKRPKAEIRAFLAWQDEPGCRYGVAVRRHYFDGDPPAAQAFVAWFTRLFGPPPRD